MTAEEAFLLLFRKFMPKAATVSIGTVSNVDKNKYTCDVERDGQPTLFNCRLNAVIDTLDSYIVAFPAIGSYVLCVTVNEPTSCYVLATTQVEEAQVKIGETTVVITDGLIEMNGGTLGGLPVVGDVTARLNLLEKAFNSLLGDFRSHNHSHPQGPTTGLLTPPATGNVIETKVSDIENLKICQ